VKFGMTEKTVCIYNPLPDITEEQLFEVAGLGDGRIRPATRSPFMMEWRYSGGREREFIDLKPGEAKQIRRIGAELFVKANAEQGAIMFDPGASRDEIVRLSIPAVQQALKFWGERGAKRISAYRKLHGLSKEELEEQKYDDGVWTYFAAQGRVKVLEQHLKDLRKELTELTSSKKKSA
jgi:hypothetical protein